MKPTLFAFITCLLSAVVLCGQSEAPPSQKAKVLIGINITNTLAGFFNSGGQDLPKDRYLFSLKLLKDNKLWRFGGNARFDASDENLNNGFRNVRESELLLRAGREWEQPINKYFSLFYGLDAVGSVFKEKSTFDFDGSVGGSLDSEETRFGMGAGPFLGVYFKLGDRIRFSTETYAYGIFYAGESITEIGQGVPDTKEEIRKFTFLPAIPNSLYVHFSF